MATIPTGEKLRDDARRAFLYKAATLGIATPGAITLLLAAGTKRAEAGVMYKGQFHQGELSAP